MKPMADQKVEVKLGAPVVSAQSYAQFTELNGQIVKIEDDKLYLLKFADSLNPYWVLAADKKPGT